MKLSTLMLASVCLLMFGGVQADAGLIVGAYNVDLGFPFAWGGTGEVTRYQQVYSASAFSGPMAISELSFFAGNGYAGLPIDDSTYTISLSTTAYSVGALNPNSSQNIGADNTTLGTFHLQGTLPQQLDFYGNMFEYDPSKGNLLMDVEVSLHSRSAMQASLKGDHSGTLMSELWDGLGFPVYDSEALVTEFNAAVPEPSTLALLGVGAIGVLAYAWRRRRGLPDSS